MSPVDRDFPNKLAAYLTEMKLMGPVSRMISDHSTAVNTVVVISS